MRLEGIRNTLNYAANRIRYLAPVPAGSRLRGRIIIAAVKDAPPDGSQNQGQNPLPCHPSVTPGRQWRPIISSKINGFASMARYP
jgi:hypothetical protein